VTLSDKITEYIYGLAVATRNHQMLLAGISTRGGISLASAARTRAFLEGRDHVIPEDVKALFVPVCAHRLIMRPVNETIDRKELLQSLLDEIPVPLA
jgi:MoxR-like ATPase